MTFCIVQGNEILHLFSSDLQVAVLGKIHITI